MVERFCVLEVFFVSFNPDKYSNNVMMRYPNDAELPITYGTFQDAKNWIETYGKQGNNYHILTLYIPKTA